MIFIRKIFRDLYKNKSRSFSIIILIFLSLVIECVYVQPGAVLEATYTKMKTDSNKADLVIDALPFNSNVFNDSLFDYWIDEYQISAIQSRLLVHAKIEINNTVKLNAHIIGIPDNQRPVINNIITPDNVYFSDKEQEAFIEKSYVESYSISDKTQLNVSINEGNINANFPIIFKGKANSIEYPFLENAGGGRWHSGRSRRPGGRRCRPGTCGRA